MGRRLNEHLRALLKPSATADPALLAAARDALAAQGREASPSAVEGWIKEHRFEVWSVIASAGALRDAIELARHEPAAPREEPVNGQGENGVSKKKPRRHEASAELPPEMAKPKPAVKAAKPKAEPRPVTIEAPAVSDEPLGEVVRKALESLGDGAAPGKIKRWIKRHYPGRKVRPAALTRAINDHRAPVNGAPHKKAPAEAPRPKAAPAAGGYDPTRSGPLRVLGIAREQGGVGKLARQVQAVKQLADQVGGVERLAVCLEALEELGVR